ncbi:MAG: oligosaccharide flippase family protein [Elusimicrobiota bacterium]
MSAKPSFFAGKQVLILSSVDWGATWQHHQALAAAFSEEGAEVFFVENTGFRGPRPADLSRVLRRLAGLFSPGRRKKGRRVLGPLVLPPTNGLFRALNAVYFVSLLLGRLRRRGLRLDPIVFAYLPTATTLQIIDDLSPRLVVYDCVDNFAGHPSPPRDLAATETELIARSDLVLTTSRYLYEDKTRRHPRVLRLHHGVSDAFFIGHDRRDGPCRKLCYFGTLWHAVDYAPIRALAKAGFEVTLIGPVKETPPPLPDSVRLRPPLAHDALPRALAGFDALLLPYVRSEYNKGVVPAKLYECLATGKPVLCSALPSMEEFRDLVHIARSPAEFVRIARDLHGTDTSEDAARRIEAARLHTTPRQVRRLENALREALHAKPPAAEKRPVRRRWLPETGESFLRGFSWIAAFFVLARVSTFLAQFLAARFLGPDEYGQAHLVIAMAAVVQILPMIGFPLALSRFGASAEGEAERGRIVSTTLLVFLIWAAASLGLLSWLSPELAAASALSREAWTLCAALAFLTSLHLVAGGSLQGLTRFRERGIVEALYGLLALAFLAGFLARGHATYQALIGSYLAGLALAAAYGFWRIRPYIRLTIDPKVLRDVLPFAFLGTVHILAMALIQAPGRIVVFHLDSARAAGIYSAYFTATVQVALAFVNMILAVLVPLASREQGQREAWSALRGFRPAAGLLLAALFALGAWLALSLLGRSYPIRPDWLALFAVAAALVLLHGVMAALFAARDLGGLSVSAGGMLAAGLGNLGFNLLLTPAWGLTGAALSLCLGYGAGLAWYAIHYPKLEAA